MKALKSPAFQIVAGSVVSVALSLTSVWLFGSAGAESSMIVMLAGFGTFLLSYIVPVIIVLLVLYRALQQRMPRKV